ncbi:HNH endonuclease family protein, partial [Erysipelatoclostridium ramosum]|nr:HNH endonuclease family protein [Thomasclavelia ramosa]
DLTDVAYVTRNGCKVKSGVLNDPYTGKVIHFTRGQNTSAAVQIDHVVALQNAWQSGAKDWNARKRMQFANDPYNLLAVDGPANQGKGSASAAYW